MFTKRVKMHDNTIRNVHEVVSVEYSPTSKLVHVQSWDSEYRKGLPTDTWLEDDASSNVLSESESWVMDRPEFEQTSDPRDDIIESLAGDLSDEQAAQVPWAYPVWAVDTRYEIGDRVTHKDVLYKCLQGHTSQSIWTPINAVSLWADLTGHGEGSDVPDWVQPGSTNPYNKGDRVRFEEQIYESVMDGNVWSPRDYPGGWKLVS